MKTAEQILKLTEPEQLFSAPEKVVEEYRALAKVWYPDISAEPKATEVFQHINYLHTVALDKITAKVWQYPGKLELHGIDKKIRRITYRRKHQFELGEMFVGDHYLVFVIANDYADLFETSRKRIASSTFTTPKMRDEFTKLLPNVKTRFETVDEKMVLVLNKTEDMFLLRDVWNYFGGKIDPRHVAWIQNCLHNLTCYLTHVKLAHNAISLDTLFISPKNHAMMLLGGWWYCVPFGAKLQAYPAKLADYIQKEDILLASPMFDLTLIRAVGRELLGDRSGMSLPLSPMTMFLRDATSGKAAADYRLWKDKVLPAMFGERRFVKMEVTAENIYG